MSNTEISTDRRAFLASAAAAMVVGALPASAATEHHHHHHGAHQDIVDAADECVATGKTCLNHCLILLGDGDTTMKECAKSVNEMIPVCGAMATLALSDSRNLRVMADACLAACKDCAAACEKHMEQHVECKDCYDACKNSIAAVEKYLNAA
ncbi:MAG: Csp1 family four helix bundle copper storage protein [Chromatiales bacterium]|nr:Csp1 family four helix bundle copper storage protein [Gammaproteobacteria bacterium]MCP5352374.1 Csp1 family four helix bundle copper storage protein [Chromatiales bacterium]